MDCRLHYSSLLRRILLMVGTLTWVIFSFHFSFFGLKTHLCETSFRYWNLHISVWNKLNVSWGVQLLDLCGFLRFLATRAAGRMWSQSPAAAIRVCDAKRESFFKSVRYEELLIPARLHSWKGIPSLPASFCGSTGVFISLSFFLVFSCFRHVYSFFHLR